MIVSQLLKKLEGVDPNLDLSNWLLAKQASKIDILSIPDSVKAVTIITSMLGKPYQTNNRNPSGVWLGYRKCIWKCNDVAMGVAISDKLMAEGVAFKITPCNWLTIFIPADLHVSDIKRRPNDISWLEETAYNREQARLQAAKAEAERQARERAREQRAWQAIAESNKLAKEAEQRALAEQQAKDEELRKQAVAQSLRRRQNYLTDELQRDLSE